MLRNGRPSSRFHRLVEIAGEIQHGALREPKSLDLPLPSAPEKVAGATYGDRVKDTSQPSPLDMMMQAEARGRVRKAIMAVCTEREQAILYARFWEGKTLEQIGQQLGLSRERIRQIIKRDVLFRLQEWLKQEEV